MKWIRDKTGRFPFRPYFEQGEIDRECEVLVTSYLQDKYGKVQYPVCTNDLTILIEKKADDLDLWADLSDLGDDIEGVTEFFPNKKPRVLISRFLSEEPRRENRLRTTITHELGHVHLHNSLWATRQDTLFPLYDNETKQLCHRESIIHAKEIDWMEWQAGYASGAFLMPFTTVNEIFHTFCDVRNIKSITSTSSSTGIELIRLIQKEFQVSEDAARVRLLKLNLLTDDPRTPNF
ncbi:MAG TPA: ImmA/IrrE family metallo-endopeptidase [Anaerovoracaceae bacterium]|nr:ImmA/IrrE family metallo-endopeptidase [Anaerovoracaceae bacterium]